MIWAAGWCSAISSAARFSCCGSIGEKLPDTTIALVPLSANCLAASTTANSSRCSKARPSYSTPPFTKNIWPLTTSARSGGHPDKGGSDRPAGRPMRTKPTRLRLERCTTAFVNCVVPITTAPILSRESSSSACRIPLNTSLVVGVLTVSTTSDPSRRAPSVLVPPTSIPMRLIDMGPSGQVRSPSRAGRHT